MTLDNLLILLLSTLFHVLANTAFKRARIPAVFSWGMIVAAVILYAPLLYFTRNLTPFSLGILALSGLLDAAYFVSMSRAYALTDLSVAYPLARGLAPLLLAVWAILFLGEAPTAFGAAGIGLIVLGLYTVNLRGPDGWKKPLHSLRHPGARFALLAGLFISLYTALDKYGLKTTGLPPLTYTYWTLFFTALWLTPLILRTQARATIREELRADWLLLLLAGLATLGAYGLVMIVVGRGTPISYAGAVREFSVVLGAFVGWRFLKEKQGPMRVLGAALVALGVVAIGLAG